MIALAKSNVDEREGVINMRLQKFGYLLGDAAVL